MHVVRDQSHYVVAPPPTKSGQPVHRRRACGRRGLVKRKLVGLLSRRHGRSRSSFASKMRQRRYRRGQRRHAKDCAPKTAQLGADQNSKQH
jgi:hypothetical protein